MDRDAPEPLIFTAWLRALAHVMLDARLGEDFSDVWFWDAPLLIEALKGGPASALCDDPEDAGDRGLRRRYPPCP